jgi:hypothetical protein
MGSTFDRKGQRSRTTATDDLPAYIWIAYRQPDPERPDQRDIIGDGTSNDWAAAIRAAERCAGWDRSAAAPLASIPDSARGVMCAIRRTQNGRVTVFPIS